MSQSFIVTKNNVRIPAPQLCSFTTVDARTKVVVNGVPHAAVTTHACTLLRGHDTYCKCKCGHQWRGWSA